MPFPRDIVVVAVDRLRLRTEGRNHSRVPHRCDDVLHHDLAIPACILLRPVHGFDIVVEVLSVLRKIRQIRIRQIDEESLHILASQFNEVAAHAVTHSARARVQHEPDVIRFVETNFDEMVAGAQRAQVVGVVAAIQLGVLGQNRIVARLQRTPDFKAATGNLTPCAAITHAAMVGASVRNRLLNRIANRLQIVGKVAGRQAGLDCHHAAANVNGI